MPKIVIAFGHRKFVGKDTCAKFLATILKVETRGLLIQRKGFADELKDIAFRLYGWAGLKERQYYDQQGKEAEKNTILPALGKSVRDVWIELGMKAREVYEHTWVDFLFRGVTADIVMIPDLRFPNEFDRVKEMGGLIFRVDNPRVPYTEDAADKPLREKPDSEWTGIINNDGCLNVLNDQLKVITQSLILPRLK